MSQQKAEIGVNVFVVRANKLLLGKRKGGADDGSWGLPGGHLEYMESLIEGAGRELQEETGLIALDLRFHHLVNDPLPGDGTHYLHINFTASKVEGEPKVCEPQRCYEWQWFDLNKLPDNIFIGHRQCIKSFNDGVSFNDHDA